MIYAVIASGSMVLIGRRFVHGVGEQEPDRSRVSLRADPTARERRKHRAASSGEEEERAGVDRSLGTVLKTLARSATRP